MYFNTTKETGKALEKYIRQAKSQDSIILDFFTKSNTKKFTPSQIWRWTGLHDDKTPLTSVRRSLNTLTRMNLIEKTNEKLPGIYKKPECVWKLK